MAVPHLDVFIAEHCFGCDEARRLAALVAARYAALSVRVVNLEHEPDRRPEALVAVPSYVLDGTVISLGNPREIDLFTSLERLLEPRLSGCRDGSP